MDRPGDQGRSNPCRLLAQRDVADLGLASLAGIPKPSRVTLKDLIVRKLQPVYRHSQARLERWQRRPWSRNRAGYGLLRIGHESGVQLGRLVRLVRRERWRSFCQAVLRTVPLPAAQGSSCSPFSVCR